MASYSVRINGFARSVESSDPDKPLLYVLRGLGLTATKFGCGLGQCGANLRAVCSGCGRITDIPWLLLLHRPGIGRDTFIGNRRCGANAAGTRPRSSG